MKFIFSIKIFYCQCLLCPIKGIFAYLKVVNIVSYALFQVIILLFQDHLLKDHPFPTELQWLLYCKMKSMCECISGLLGFIDLFVFMPVLDCLNYCSKVNLKIRQCIFFIKIILAILGPLDFHIRFRISLSVSTKCLLGLWLGLCFIYGSIWGELTSSWYCCLPVHVHDISLRSLIPFGNVLKYFQVVFLGRVLVLLKFIHRYLFLMLQAVFFLNFIFQVFVASI